MILLWSYFLKIFCSLEPPFEMLHNHLKRFGEHRAHPLSPPGACSTQAGAGIWWALGKVCRVGGKSKGRPGGSDYASRCTRPALAGTGLDSKKKAISPPGRKSGCGARTGSRLAAPGWGHQRAPRRADGRQGRGSRCGTRGSSPGPGVCAGTVFPGICRDRGLRERMEGKKGARPWGCPKRAAAAGWPGVAAVAGARGEGAVG